MCIKLDSYQESLHVARLTKRVTTGYYQQDGATCHTSNASVRVIESFFKDRIISKKNLATQITRSNACRLLFGGLLKCKVYKNTPRTIEHLIDAIRHEIEAVKVDTLEIVFQNLEKRVQVCLDVKGDHFQHRL